MTPDNVWLTADGPAKLLDFGLVRAGGDAVVTHPGTIVGTPRYVAPEQARADAADPRSDVFGLGAVLFYALTAGYPFPGGDVLAVLAAHASHTPPPADRVNRAVPRRVARVVGRMLEKDPARRPPNAADAAAELAESLVPAPVPVPPDEPPLPTDPDRVAAERLLDGTGHVTLLIRVGGTERKLSSHGGAGEPVLVARRADIPPGPPEPRFMCGTPHSASASLG